MSAEMPRWFNATIGWGQVGGILMVLVTAGGFLISTWQDNKQQSIETRTALRELTQKLDDSMSKRDDRLSNTERELNGKIDAAVKIGTRERQILADRIVALEARQDGDDKRSRDDAVAMATLKEQMNFVASNVETMRDILLHANPGYVGPARPLRPRGQ